MDLTEHVGYTYKLLRPCGQNTRTPIDPYSSDRKRVISYGLPTGYRSVWLSNKNQKWDPLRAMKTSIRKKVGHTT